MKKITTSIALIFLLTTFLFGDLIEEALFISKLYEDGFYEIAMLEIAKIENKLENDRYSHQILAIKADILLQREDIVQARDILIRLNSLSLAPQLKAQVMFSLIVVEKTLDNYAEAHDLIQLFITRFPENDRIPTVYTILADIYFEQGNFIDAEAIYKNLHNNNRSPQTFLNLIKMDVENNKLFEAEILLKNMNETFPRDVIEAQQALLIILTAYETRAEYQNIIQLSKEYNIIPANPITQKYIAANIQLKNFNDAEELLKDISSDNDSVDYYTALIHKERGEDHMALPLFRSLARRDIPDNMKTMSFFNMIQIIAKSNTQEAYDMLINFLLSNPDQEWEADILYQIAFIDYQNRNYERAYDYLQRALNFKLNEINYQRAIYLKGELEFLLGHYENSYRTFFNDYDNMPVVFKDEVVFKMGLNSFFLNLPDRADTHFNRLIADFPDSQKIGIAYFYLGEIALFRDPNQARSYYMQALSGDMDKAIINLRLAYVEYLRSNYTSALEFLNQVPDTDEYMFDKYLLQGVILIAQRNFNQALEAFRIAERSAVDQVSVEFIWARQALLHYNLQNYDTAMNIYRRLATQSETPGMFILSAASAAFNADNYYQAIELYTEFINDFPESDDIFRAKLGLANCYYNLGLYELAIEIWRELVNENISLDLVDTALKGLQDSYDKLNRQIQFNEFLHIVASQSQDRNFLIYLYEFKANLEYEQRNYSSSLATINQMLRQFPDKREDLKTMILLANNYTWLNRYEEADQIYIDLSTTHNDPFIYYEWGHIKYAQGDYVAAVRRFKRAVENNTNEQYWLTLLEKLLETKDNEFMMFYNQFVDFAPEYHQNLAMLYLIDWQIYTEDYEEALANANMLLSINNPQIRARTTFKIAEIYYILRQFDDAISNFLRIRYFFNEFSDIRWAAELYIAKIYVQQGDRERGRNHFESIRQNLTPEQIADFDM
ncbi:MAG: tetratricopeptide repeat protein [Candidatus Cloacimonetes bacterium]|nr:tetratricopeptide repeat protein [Candidatus Cloacimonadota bacterium]